MFNHGSEMGQNGFKPRVSEALLSRNNFEKIQISPIFNETGHLVNLL